MTKLDEILRELKSHEGVEHIILVGRDGLLVQDLGDDDPRAREMVAAMLPGVADACTAAGLASDKGPFATAAIEFGAGVVIVSSVTPDLLLAAVVRAGVGFAPLLRALRADRARLAAIL